MLLLVGAGERGLLKQTKLEQTTLEHTTLGQTELAQTKLEQTKLGSRAWAPARRLWLDAACCA